MLDIKPVTTLYPPTKPVHINKDDPHSRREQPQKQPVAADEALHSTLDPIDEIA